jgi:hypothetical protein
VQPARMAAARSRAIDVQRTATGFVLGYHGCDRAIAERLVGGTAFKWSRNQYDWLGWGAYFWENDPVRDLQWARLVGRRTGRLKKPGVVGAIIDLGLCLDLTTQSSLDVIRTAYQGLAAVARATGARLLENTDELRRPLDCAVLNYLYESMPEPKFQTVRGVFIEGKPLYPGALIRERTHVQVAVRGPVLHQGCVPSFSQRPRWSGRRISGEEKWGQRFSCRGCAPGSRMRPTATGTPPRTGTTTYSLVIASTRIGAPRRPSAGSAKQSRARGPRLPRALRALAMTAGFPAGEHAGA